jgi:transposase
MRKTMKCRLFSTKYQQRLINKILEFCCLVYNQMLAYRTEPWEKHQGPLSLYEDSALLPQWKQESQALSALYLQVLQNIQARITHPYKAFFRQFKTSETPNYPQIVQQLVATYSAVTVEGLQICNMLWNGPRWRAIVDLAWGQFSRILTYKAACVDWRVIIIGLTRLRRCVRGVDCVPKNPLLYVNISVSPVSSIWTEPVRL